MINTDKLKTVPKKPKHKVPFGGKGKLSESPTIELNDQSKVTLDDGDKKQQVDLRKGEIKIVGEADIESSHTTSLQDITEERKTTVTVTRRPQQKNHEKPSLNKVNNIPEQIKVNTTSTGPTIKLIYVEDIQNNPPETGTILKPMPKYIRMRRIGPASYPQGNNLNVLFPKFSKIISHA